MDMKKRIIRVFPTKTNATPTDELVRIRETPSFFDEADEVHVSVTFTWDIPIAEWLAKQWEPVATVKIGGPAYNEPGGDFIPGMYMRHGYVITSRGCPNRCWFCAVPKREGGMLRELPVTDGWILTDDNLLACSPGHIDEVFAMLARQPHKPQFTGGLEAALLTPTMAQRIHELHPQSLFFAYDTPNDLDPLVEAGKMLIEAGFTKSSNSMRCYVLCGYKGDTFEKAQTRMGEAWRAGFMPMAMLFRDLEGKYSTDWRRFQRQWANPTITICNCIKHFYDKAGKPKMHTYRGHDVRVFRKQYADDLLRPVFDWSAQQVIDYILSAGLEPNPLYTMGYKRVGCWPCVMASSGIY